MLLLVNLFAARKDFLPEGSFILQLLEFEIWDLACGQGPRREQIVRRHGAIKLEVLRFGTWCK